MATLVTWYGFPSLDGVTVKLGVHAWPGIDEPVDPDAAVRQPDADDARRFAGIVAETLPGLDPNPVRMKACMYSMTPDADFLVGPSADLPGITLLGGFSGHGFKFAPVIGDIAADLAIGGRTDRSIGFLSPDRFRR